MAYIGLKTSGHSGTSFKHNKVFTRSNKFLNTKNKYENVKIESREKKQQALGFKIYRILVGIIFIIILLIITAIFIYRIDVLTVEKEKPSIEDSTYLDNLDYSEDKVKSSLLIKAQNEYNSGNFQTAHEKLYAILMTDKNNTEAEILLIKVLKAKCKKYSGDFDCKQLEKYSKHLVQKYLSNISKSNITI